MKKLYAVTTFIILFVWIGLALGADKTQEPSNLNPKKITTQQEQVDKANNIVNLKLNDATAMQLAEIILTSRFGEKVLKQKPWIVTDNGNSYKITGTLHTKLGGVAEIIISKSDARVLSVIHGK